MMLRGHTWKFWIWAYLLPTACYQSPKANSNLPTPLNELTTEKYEIPDATREEGEQLWSAVRELLGMSDFNRSSPSQFLASLAEVPTLASDPTQAAQFALTRTAAVVANAVGQSCASVQPLLVDLNPGAVVTAKSGGAITISTGGFKLVEGVPQNLAAPIKVYWLKYKLKDDTSYRHALLTVPSTAPVAALGAVKPDSAQTDYRYPLALYAHLSTGGLAYEELALSLGNLQANHIVVAPVFPGEPLCSTYDEGKASCSGTNIISGGEAVGSSAPYENDVSDLLGLYDCIKDNAATAFATVDALGAAGSESLANKMAKISAQVKADASTLAAQLAGAGQTTPAATVGAIAASADQPLTLLLGMGRGASLIPLALGRAGAVNSALFSSATDASTTAVRTALTAAGVGPQLFSCAAAVAPQASFTAGKNKIFLDYWIKGSSDFLTASQQASLDAIPGFASIKARIAALHAQPELDAEARALAIAAYVGSIDGTLHLGLAHAALANWGKSTQALLWQTRAQLATDAGTAALAAAKASATLGLAQGAGLLLHGMLDQVASVANSQLASAIAVATTASLETAAPRKVGGVHWLGLGFAPAEVASDRNHVTDASFTKGKALAADSSLMSSLPDDVDAYLDLSPAVAMGSWLLGSCHSSFSADAVEP